MTHCSAQGPGCRRSHITSQISDRWIVSRVDRAREQNDVGIRAWVHPQRGSGEACVAEAFAGWNFVSSIGAFIGGLAFLVFLYVVFRTFTSKEHLADNYWGEGATTLEWTVSSPPPFHTFEELPRIS